MQKGKECEFKKENFEKRQQKAEEKVKSLGKNVIILLYSQDFKI